MRNHFSVCFERVQNLKHVYIHVIALTLTNIRSSCIQWKRVNINLYQKMVWKEAHSLSFICFCSNSYCNNMNEITLFNWRQLIVGMFWIKQFRICRLHSCWFHCVSAEMTRASSEIKKRILSKSHTDLWCAIQLNRIAWLDYEIERYFYIYPHGWFHKSTRGCYVIVNSVGLNHISTWL